MGYPFHIALNDREQSWRPPQCTKLWIQSMRINTVLFSMSNYKTAPNISMATPANTRLGQFNITNTVSGRCLYIPFHKKRNSHSLLTLANSFGGNHCTPLSQDHSGTFILVHTLDPNTLRHTHAHTHTHTCTHTTLFRNCSRFQACT